MTTTKADTLLHHLAELAPSRLTRRERVDSWSLIELAYWLAQAHPDLVDEFVADHPVCK